MPTVSKERFSTRSWLINCCETFSKPCASNSVGRIGTYSRGAGSREDQTAQVCRALVAERSGGVDEGADAIRLQRRADEGSAPRDRGARGFP